MFSVTGVKKWDFKSIINLSNVRQDTAYKRVTSKLYCRSHYGDTHREHQPVLKHTSCNAQTDVTAVRNEIFEIFSSNYISPLNIMFIGPCIVLIVE